MVRTGTDKLWWEEPLGRFLEHLDARDRQGQCLFANTTRWWYRWALQHFVEYFPDAPPESKAEVVNFVSGLMVADNGNGTPGPIAVGTKRSYYWAVGSWFSWCRQHVPGYEALPILSYETFGRKAYRHRNGATPHRTNLP